MRHRRDEVLPDLLERAVVADVLERIDGALVEPDAGDRDPALPSVALERHRFHARRDPRPARQQLLEAAADDLLAPDARDRLRGAVPEPDEAFRVDEENAVAHRL